MYLSFVCTSIYHSACGVKAQRKSFSLRFFFLPDDKIWKHWNPLVLYCFVFAKNRCHWHVSPPLAGWRTNTRNAIAIYDMMSWENCNITAVQPNAQIHAIIASCASVQLSVRSWEETMAATTDGNKNTLCSTWNTNGDVNYRTKVKYILRADSHSHDDDVLYACIWRISLVNRSFGYQQGR